GGAGQVGRGGFASPAPIAPSGRSAPSSAGFGRGDTAGDQLGPDQPPGLPGAGPTGGRRGGTKMLPDPAPPHGQGGTPQAGPALSPSSGSDPSSPPPGMGPQSGCDNAFSEYPLPTDFTWPNGITQGPDGNLWFTKAGGFFAPLAWIGRITPA